jgi:hypothetical protein
MKNSVYSSLFSEKFNSFNLVIVSTTQHAQGDLKMRHKTHQQIQEPLGIH